VTLPRKKLPQRGRVVSRQPDGSGCAIEWINANGEHVIGDFVRVGWSKAPADFGAKVDAIFSTPPVVTYHGPRHRAGRATGR
jgi:hypothetical protein